MRTLQEELIKKGLATKKELNGEPIQEFIIGEIHYTRSAGINEIGKSLYGKPIKESIFKFKPRHGRTRIMNIKEDMDKKKISRNSFQFTVVNFLLLNSTGWRSAIQVSAAVGWNRPSTSSLLTNLRKTGFLYFEGRQGEKGWVYRMKEQYHKCTPEEICLEYLDRIKQIRKSAVKKTTGEKDIANTASKSTKHWINKTQKLIEGKLKEAGKFSGKEVSFHNSPITFSIPEKIEIVITLKLG